MIRNAFVKFVNNESGAVTVDWVVLTAAIVGIAMAVIGMVSGGVETASNGINGELETAGTLGDWFGGSEYGMDNFLENYVPLSPLHGETWTSDVYASNSAKGEGYLIEDYNRYYDMVDGGGMPPREYDHLANLEQVMVDKGYEIPEGNTSAAEFREEYLGT
jgi:Flp pilus assembly pilin Flp